MHLLIIVALMGIAGIVMSNALLNINAVVTSMDTAHKEGSGTRETLAYQKILERVQIGFLIGLTLLIGSCIYLLVVAVQSFIS